MDEGGFLEEVSLANSQGLRRRLCSFSYWTSSLSNWSMCSVYIQHKNSPRRLRSSCTWRLLS